MLNTQYQALLNHLSKKFNISRELAYDKIPNINLKELYRQNTTELHVRGQTYYLTGNNIYDSIFKLEHNMVIADHIGYLANGKIHLTNKKIDNC